MEGKLAETAPKRPLALTIGAAAATLVVILGVLSGPAIVSCFNSEDGLGLCLRGKMAEVGLAPPLPAPAVAEAETQAEAAEADINLAVADEAVTPEPELDVTPPVATLDVAAAADGVIVATFGLLRAEPDGSIVIAGSGTPGSRVEVYANGELLGTVEVEASGDWVFVPDAPLAPGGIEITLGEVGKDGTAAQSFIVVLNEDRSTEPLVVASTPGRASDVLQGLTQPVAEPAIASASELAVEAEVSVPTPAEQPERPVDDAAASAEEPVVTIVAADAPAAEGATPAEPAPDLTALPPSATVAPEPQPGTAIEPVTTAEAANEQPSAAATETVTAVAPQAPAPEAPAIAPVELAGVQPTIDAIEIEGERTFFAGGGPNDRVVRLYVDDGFVADADVAESRWLIESGPVLNKPSQRVRIDLIEPGTGAVMARSEVDFVVDLPATAGDQVVVADADVPASEPIAPTVQAPAPSAEIQTGPGEAPAPAADAAVTETPAAEPPVSEPSAEPVAAPPVQTMVAVSLGDPEAQRFASGKAIIRRGDNLWTIARRVYGEGLKYTTIYQANTGQIRDPDRIYPGQVFDLPTVE